MSNSEVKILVDETTGQRYRFAAIDGADLQPEPTPTPAPAQPTPAPAAKRDNRSKPRGKKNETEESLKARLAAWEKGETQPDAIIQQEDGSTRKHSEIQEEKAKQGGGFRRSSKTKAGKDRFVPLCDSRCLGTCMYTTKAGETKMYVVWSKGKDGSIFLRPISSNGFCFGGWAVAKEYIRTNISDVRKAGESVDMTNLCGCDKCVAKRKAA